MNKHMKDLSSILSFYRIRLDAIIVYFSSRISLQTSHSL